MRPGHDERDGEDPAPKEGSVMPTPDDDPEAAAGISTSVEHVDDVTILYVGGEIDLANCDFFRSTLEPCIASGAILVVDVADLDFLVASGGTDEPGTAAFPDVIASLRAQAHGPVAES